MSASVSIVIPVKDGIDTLPALLDAVAAQEHAGAVEVVAVDSGSTDGSAALLCERGVRLIEIAGQEFNHGLTRNLGVANARGDLVVLLVQDALPAGSDWLRELTRPLLEDSRVAGSWARQVPRPESSAVTRHHLQRWLGASAEERIRALPAPDALDAMPPRERFEHCAFDNVCSCLRRSVWEAQPFPETPIAEDVEWARSVLLAGHRVVYAPRAVVVHSHERSARYELRRTYLLHRRLRSLFGLATVPTLGDLARAIASTLVLHAGLVARDAHPGARSLRRVGRALALAAAWPLGQYLGARAADRGGDDLRPGGR